jgi:hypothetical protein
VSLQIVDLPELRLGKELFTREASPDPLPATTGWMHSGCAILDDGTVVVAHPEGRRLIFLHHDHQPGIVEVPVLEMHTIRRDPRGGEETLWLVNNGHRFVRGQPDYAHYRERGSVIRVRLDGTVVQELPCPQIGAYATETWQPTSLTTMPGGSIWVADGYGMNLLHRFSPEGVYERTWDGSSTGLPLSCPHGLATRGDDLLIADRGNRRLLVIPATDAVTTLDAPLTSPSSILVRGDWIVVTELFGGLAIFHHDRYVGHFARSTDNPERDGWPNDRDEAGNMCRPTLGPELHSPHGITADDQRVIVTEWLIGGRLTQYSRTS